MAYPFDQTRCYEPRAPKPPTRAQRADSIFQHSNTSFITSKLEGISVIDIDDDNGSTVVGDPETPPPAARRIPNIHTIPTVQRDTPQAPDHGKHASATDATATQGNTPQAADHDDSHASGSPPYTFGLADIDAAIPSPPPQRQIPDIPSPPPERKRWFNQPDRYDRLELEDRQRPACINPLELLYDIQSDAGAMDAAIAEVEGTSKACDAIERQRTRAHLTRMMESGEWVPAPEQWNNATSIGVDQVGLAQSRSLPEMQFQVLLYWRSTSTILYMQRLKVLEVAPTKLYRIELRDHPVFGHPITFFFPIGHAHTYDGHQRCDRCTEAGLKEAARVAVLVMNRKLVGDAREIFCAEPVLVGEAVQ